MIRILAFLAVVFALAAGASWIADRPGAVAFDWLGYHVETSMTVALVALLVFVVVVLVVWSILVALWRSPRRLRRYFVRSRRERGRNALSRGLVAVGAGDLRLARRYMTEARRAVPHDPATRLLEAQTAQLAGDRAGARAAFEAMLEREETRLLGLRGLFVEATREGAAEAAHSYAERAAREAPALPWAASALFEQAAAARQFDRAIELLSRNAGARLVEKPRARRLKAVLLTARALELEAGDPELARAMALEAHSLAPDLEPAAAVAGRLLTRNGEVRKATKVVEATWKRSPHPELAETYAAIRPGDSARDRLKRMRTLAALSPQHVEGERAVARAAIEAREFETARGLLRTVLETRPSQRACLLMADLEEAEFGAGGRMREWLGRAVNAPRDPVWTADGYVSEHWGPISPVTGRLDAFEWKVPVEALDAPSAPVVDEALFGPPPAPPAPPAPAVLVPAVSAGPAAAAGAVSTAAAATPGTPPDVPRPRAASEAATASPSEAGPFSLSHPPDDPGPDFDEDDLTATTAAKVAARP